MKARFRDWKQGFCYGYWLRAARSGGRRRHFAGYYSITDIIGCDFFSELGSHYSGRPYNVMVASPFGAIHFLSDLDGQRLFASTSSPTFGPGLPRLGRSWDLRWLAKGPGPPYRGLFFAPLGRDAR